MKKSDIAEAWEAINNRICAIEDRSAAPITTCELNRLYSLNWCLQWHSYEEANEHLDAALRNYPDEFADKHAELIAICSEHVFWLSGESSADLVDYFEDFKQSDFI